MKKNIIYDLKDDTLKILELCEPGMEPEEITEEYLEEIKEEIRKQNDNAKDKEKYIVELAKLVKNIEAMQNVAEQEIKRLQERTANEKIFIDTIREEEFKIMQENKIKKTRSGMFSVWIQENSRAPIIFNDDINLEDLSTVPERYIKYVPMLDREKIRQDAKKHDCDIAVLGEKGYHVHCR